MVIIWNWLRNAIRNFVPVAVTGAVTYATTHWFSHLTPKQVLAIVAGGSAFYNLAGHWLEAKFKWAKWLLGALPQLKVPAAFVQTPPAQTFRSMPAPLQDTVQLTGDQLAERGLDKQPDGVSTATITV